MTTATVETQSTETAANYLVTLPAADLYNALGNAQLFASKDTSLPVLNAVRLKYDAATKALTATATDRYRMIFTLAGDAETMTTEAESFEAIIPLAQVKEMITHLKGFKKFDDPDMQIELMDSKLEMIYYAHGNELVIQVPLMDWDQEYPAIHKLMSDIFKKKPGTPKTDIEKAAHVGSDAQFGAYASFNPSYLEDVAKVKDLRLTPSQRRSDAIDLALSTRQNKPSLFRHGSWAYGMLMPIFNKDRRDELTHLVDMTDAPAWIN